MPGTRRLRIIMLSHSVYERDTRVRRYAERLAEDGHRVDVVCYGAGGAPGWVPPPGVTLYRVPGSRTRREGIGLMLDWAATAAAMGVITTALSLARRPDLVHVHNMPDFLVFCAIAPAIAGCPVLLNIHDPVPEIARSKLGLTANHPVVRLLALLERVSIAFSTRVLTATDTFRRLLIERGADPSKITVIANAADERVFPREPGRPPAAAPSPGDRFTLLYVGTVAHRYGLHVAVRALPRVREAIPGVRLQVVPKIRREGRALDECLALARRLGVRDLIEVLDSVPLEGMPALLRAADVGIYPALSDCHMDLALSLKIPEMVNMGLPIVATRLPVLEELYGDDGIAFVPSGDPEALAARIIELRRAPETLNRLAETARRRSRDFTWQNQYQRYLEVVDHVLGGAPEPKP